MSGHEEDRPAESGRIRFTPHLQAQDAPEGRTFLIEGAYEPEDLERAVEFLVNDAEEVFKSVEQIDGGLRVVLQFGYGWLTELPFYEATPPTVVAINKKIGEVGKTPVLTYLLFILCSYLDWNAEDVLMGEALGA